MIVSCTFVHNKQGRGGVNGHKSSENGSYPFVT